MVLGRMTGNPYLTDEGRVADDSPRCGFVADPVRPAKIAPDRNNIVRSKLITKSSICRSLLSS
jgi:hypothetical protein